MRGARRVVGMTPLIVLKPQPARFDGVMRNGMDQGSLTPFYLAINNAKSGSQ